MKKWMVLAVVIYTGIFFLTQEQRFAYRHLPQRSFSKDRASGEDEGRRLEVSFAYERRNVPGSNQIAVWIEDMEGNYIKNSLRHKLYCGRRTASAENIASRMEKSGRSGGNESFRN